MLCTFTTEHGALIVRSDDIRSIDDNRYGATILTWHNGVEVVSYPVLGTATENRDRIQREELDLIAQVEEHRYQLQRRLADGYPAVPVQRGKQR